MKRLNVTCAYLLMDRYSVKDDKSGTNGTRLEYRPSNVTNARACVQFSITGAANCVSRLFSFRSRRQLSLVITRRLVTWGRNYIQASTTRSVVEHPVFIQPRRAIYVIRGRGWLSAVKLHPRVSARRVCFAHYTCIRVYMYVRIYVLISFRVEPAKFDLLESDRIRVTSANVPSSS